MVFNALGNNGHYNTNRPRIQGKNNKSDEVKIENKYDFSQKLYFLLKTVPIRVMNVYANDPVVIPSRNQRE